MIRYSNATVPCTNPSLIVQSKTSLDTLLLQYHSCEGGFVIRLHLIPLISGQSGKKFSQNFSSTKPNTALDEVDVTLESLPQLASLLDKLQRQLHHVFATSPSTELSIVLAVTNIVPLDHSL